MDDLRPLAPSVNERRNHFGRVLQIGVHVHDGIAGRRRHTREHAFRDAEPPGHVEDLHARIPVALVQQNRERVVC